MNSKMKNLIRQSISADSIRISKDGTVRVKDFYFYQHGKSVDLLAQSIQINMAKAGVVVKIVDMQDCWNQWPKDSWFQVDFVIKAN